MKSLVRSTGSMILPMFIGKVSMLPFQLSDLNTLPTHLRGIAALMLNAITDLSGTAFFTLHGKKLEASQTLRRGGPHTDGNYEPIKMSFGSGGGNGWKVGETGPQVGSELHTRQYVSETGGIILASNFESCLGWEGEYEGEPLRGGDCRHIDLDEPFMLESNKVYYGNNHFIHESLPVSEDVHRVFARITLPEGHIYH